MTEQKYNVDLMLAIRQQITAHPESHEQRFWAQRTECGTTYCIAGWAVTLTGKAMEWRSRPGPSAEIEGAWRVSDLHGGRGISAVAADLLGLTGEEAESLFHQGNNARALARLDELIETGKNQS